jgi:hypothetical protein
MPTQRNEVITKALDILGGTPVFRGARVPFRPCWAIRKVGKLWMRTAVHALEHAKSLVVSQL